MKTSSNSKFLLVKHECGNEQYVFNTAKRTVLCSLCKKPLARPTGGYAKILGKIMKVV
ncbi:MAG: 30S ribosomal protein S27e [Candidatus Micrarchaeia archaeon]